MKKLLIIITTAFILTACGSNAADTSSQTVELTDVNLQMNWIHEYSVAPIHSAIREGFFEAEGLNVTALPGGFDEDGNFIDSFTPIITGEAMFGMAGADQILEARENGTPLVAVMALLQRSPSVLISLEDSEIQRPQDLEGKRVMTADDNLNILQILFENQDIDESAVEILPRTSFGVDPLLNDETDVLVAWIINEGVQVTESGNTPSFITLSDYGIDYYNIVFFTTEDVVNNEPDTVQRFVNAVTQGIEFSISNPEQAIEHTLSYNGDLETDAQLRRLNAMIPLMNVPGISIGDMDEETWNFSYDLLRSEGLIGNVDVADAFTTRFVEEASSTD